MSAHQVMTGITVAVSLIAGIASAQHIVPSALLTIDQNRSTVVDRIVSQWGDRLASSDVGLSSQQLREVLSGLRSDHLLAASLAGSIDGLRDVVSGALVHTDAAVSPGLMHTKALGDRGDDLVYSPIVPCRILDTRNGTTPPYNAVMMGGSAFPVAANLGSFAPQGGSATNCTLPASFAAIAVTLTVLNPNFDAFLAASSSSNYVTLIQAIAMDFSANKGLANTVVVPVDGSIKFYLGMPAQVTSHVIADAVGYFRTPNNYGGTHTITGQDATDSGGFNNTATGDYSTVAGGNTNTASATYSTVAGGGANTASGTYSFVAGGIGNTASGTSSSIGGGHANTTTGTYGAVAGGNGNNGSGSYSAVAGGANNTASGHYSSVSGGAGNVASGDYSVAAGLNAQADATGCFAFANWSNSSIAGCRGTPNVARFLLDHGLSVDYQSPLADGSGSRWISIGDKVNGQTIATWTSAYLSDGGAWTNASDAAKKADFAQVNKRDILDRVIHLPITTWRYNNEGNAVRHMGPVAQDFRSAFNLGNDDKHISTIDADGVALAAIQGLHQLLQQKDARLQQQSRDILTLKRKLQAVEAKLRMPASIGSNSR